MTVRASKCLLVSAALLLGLFPATISAQEAPEWWAPVSDKYATERSVGKPASKAKGNARKDRGPRGPAPQAHRGRPGARGLHVPKGHLPPPGECRLWYPGRPPGQQPSPMACNVAYRQQRGSAVIVTHRGPVPRRPVPRWEARPPRDVVIRRPPREEGVHVSVEIMIDMLGRSGVRRLEEQRRRLGISGALTGRWVSEDRSAGGVLQVRAGRRPLAELVDRTGDGRVDAFYVREDR